MRGRSTFARFSLCTLVWLAVAACSARQPVSPPLGPSPTTMPPSSTALPAATFTPQPPTATPIPLAALVNGEEILLSEYETSLAQFQAAQAESGIDLATEEVPARVLEDLIDQVLLAQAAAEAGFVVDAALVEERRAALEEQIGGRGQLEAWMAQRGYDEESFTRALARSIAAAWMRDEVIAAVPASAEQVRVRQILLYNSEDAQQVLDQLQSGEDFTNLAQIYDPQGTGNLGWFPRNYLAEPELEAAAFALQPEEISPILETRLGFHILQVLDRQEDRKLDPEARLSLQMKALESWLAERKQQSQIEIRLP